MANKRFAPTFRALSTTTEPALDTDEILATRGDADSFIRLYHTHVPGIYRYLLARLGNQQDAEDVTSQVFERMWKSMGRYRPKGTFRSWLFTIARRTLVDHYRRQATATASMQSSRDVLIDSSVDPEKGALLSDQVRQVFVLIACLHQDQQDIIALRFLGELRYDEIALIMGKSESAVKMMAYRALEEIRRRYPDVNG